MAACCASPVYLSQRASVDFRLSTHLNAESKSTLFLMHQLRTRFLQQPLSHKQRACRQSWADDGRSGVLGPLSSSSSRECLMAYTKCRLSSQSFNHSLVQPDCSQKRLLFSQSRKRRWHVVQAMLAEPELSEVAQIPEVLAASWDLLRAFDRNDARGEPQPSLESAASRAALRDAVLVASRAAEMNEQASPLLGICASSVADGIRALQEWTAALNTTMSMPVSKEDGHADISKIDTPVYIKYNARSLFCYLTKYTGQYRGVIVQLGQHQVGHLPLALFKKE